jgi:hypothetical protein
VWLLTEVVTVGEHSAQLDITVLLKNSGAFQFTETFPGSKNATV